MTGRRRPATFDRRALRPSAIVLIIALIHPALGLVGAMAWAGGTVAGRARRRSRLRRRADDDLAVLARVLLIGLTAGLPAGAALEAAAEEVSAGLAAPARALLREARRWGLAEALARHDGALRPLAQLLARAQLTGAPVVPAVAAFVGERRSIERTRALEAARRLPVKLVVPLTLLILPGFVLITTGPAVVATLVRTLGPLVP